MATNPTPSMLAYSRETGDMLELVPSASEPGKFHLVDPVNRQCDCRGWEFRRTCRHLSPLALARPLQSDYAKALGEPAPEPIRVPLVGRLSA